MRNIPSAVLRFSIYEELKHIFVIEDDKERKKGGFNWKIFLAGAASGTISSVMSKSFVHIAAVFLHLYLYFRRISFWILTLAAYQTDE